MFDRSFQTVVGSKRTQIWNCSCDGAWGNFINYYIGLLILLNERRIFIFSKYICFSVIPMVGGGDPRFNRKGDSRLSGEELILMIICYNTYACFCLFYMKHISNSNRLASEYNLIERLLFIRLNSFLLNMIT